MVYEWGHPVATLPSDEGDRTSLSQNDVNSANHNKDLKQHLCCRPIGLAPYGRSNRKSIGSPEAVPLRSAPSTSGNVNISMFLQYRMRTSYEGLRHKNRRYGGAASVALRLLARGLDSQNAARLRRIGGGMPSGTLGPPDRSFHLLVFIRALFVKTSFVCCLVRRSAKVGGGQGGDRQRARALQIR
eukprot:162051-Pleurochrysis_carterae.AAC.1